LPLFAALFKVRSDVEEQSMRQGRLYVAVVGEPAARPP